MHNPIDTFDDHEAACICFPSDEHPSFNKEEFRAADELPCRLHGNRLPAGTLAIYRAQWVACGRATGWSNHSPQYRRAMAASYDYLEHRIEKAEAGI